MQSQRIKVKDKKHGLKVHMVVHVYRVHSITLQPWKGFNPGIHIFHIKTNGPVLCSVIIVTTCSFIFVPMETVFSFFSLFVDEFSSFLTVAMSIFVKFRENVFFFLLR